MLALARKYRPKRFADVAVQDHVASTLKGAIARGRVAHGYLLCGPRGTGKTTLARVLAMALNCEAKQADGEPCGTCASCSRIWTGAASLDVVEIDAASNRGVDDARELRERAMYAPTGADRHKVYIVDEAHMLTREAWNALLKILEEPPPRVVFVFATTEPQKIAQAAAPVLSRLQRFDLKRIGPADVRDRLQGVLVTEGVEADPEALAMIARAADGSMRDALSLTDQVLSFGEGMVTPQRVRDALGLVPEDETLRLLDVVLERRPADVFEAVGRLADHGVDFALLLADFSDLLRAQLAVSLGGTVPGLGERLHQALAERVPRAAAPDLLRMLRIVLELEPQFRRSGQQQLLFETLLVRFALLDRTVELEAVLRGLPAEGGDRPPPSPPSGGGGSRRLTEAQAAGGGSASASPAPTAGSGARRAAPPGPAAPSAPPVIADAAPAVRTVALDLNRLAERWDDVVDHLRRAGRGIIASTLQAATPVAVAGTGLVTIAVANPVQAEAIQSYEQPVLAALQSFFDGVTRLAVRVEGRAAAEAPRRLTAESVQADRLAMLRRRDPALDAAVDLLDLRLVE